MVQSHNQIRRARSSAQQAIDLAREAIAHDDAARAILSACPAALAVLQDEGSFRRLDREVHLREACAAAAGAGEYVGEAPVLLDAAQAVRWRMVVANWSIARRMSLRLSAYGPVEELEQLAMLGLYEAAKRFDPERKIVFYTYARWWVIAQITRRMSDSTVGSSTTEFARTLRKVIADAERAGLPRPSTWALAEMLEVTEARVVDALTNTRAAVSMSTPLHPDGDAGWLGDQVASQDDEDPQVWSDIGILIEHVRQLPERQRQVIARRFGLDGGEPETLSEIGRSFGLCRERVRQVEFAAMANLRAMVADPLADLLPDEPRDVKVQPHRAELRDGYGPRVFEARIRLDWAVPGLATRVLDYLRTVGINGVPRSVSRVKKAIEVVEKTSRAPVWLFLALDGVLFGSARKLPDPTAPWMMGLIEDRVCRYLEAYPESTVTDVSTGTGIGQRRISDALGRLRKEGRARRIDEAKVGARWVSVGPQLDWTFCLSGLRRSATG